MSNPVAHVGISFLQSFSVDRLILIDIAITVHPSASDLYSCETTQAVAKNAQKQV